MKNYYLTFFMSLSLLLSYFNFAQTVTWTGAGMDDYWNNPENWNPMGVPGPTNDVVLPPGSVSEHAFTSLTVNSVTVENTASLELSRSLDVVSSFTVDAGGTVVWSEGTINGAYVLDNNGTVIYNSAANNTLSGGATFNNNAQLTFDNSGDINLNGANFNNNVTGVIEFANGGGIRKLSTAPFLLTNTGIIRKTGGVTSNIVADFDNSGTIESFSGVLSIRNSDFNSFNGGTFNVGPGARIELDNPGIITATGTFDGIIDGDLWWNANLIVANNLTFDFAGTNMPSWRIGTLSGGGTLINNSDLLITNSGAQNAITDNTTLQNDGNLFFDGSSRVNLNNGIIFNSASGFIEFQDDGVGISFLSGTTHTINNQGTIEKSGGGASDTQLRGTYNNEGIIRAANGTIEFSGSTTVLNNTPSGEIRGAATIILPAPPNFINDGSIFPGASPGVLTLQGTFVSSATTNYNIELNGSSQGIDYDLINIIGNADFDGSITTNLGFSPDINDEFIIATTTGTINTCNLPAMTSASFNSDTYNIDVLCRNNNELILRITDILSVDDLDLDSRFSLLSNPVSEFLILNNPLNRFIGVVSIIDINGRSIIRIPINSDKKSVELSVNDLSSGLYFLKISSDNRIETIKFFKD